MLDELLTDKRIKYAFFGLLAIAFIVIVYIVWIPKNNELEISKYTAYDENTANEALREKYVKTITSYMRVGNTEKLKELLNSNYLVENELTAEECINALAKNGLLSLRIEAINPITVVCGNNVLHTYIVTNGTNREKVNVFETYPNTYTMFFGDSVIYQDIDVSGVSQGVNFEISKMTVKNNQLTYEVKCTNLSSNSIVIDTTSASSVVVATKSGNVYTLIGGINSSKDVTLSKDSSINMTLDFAISMSEAFNISKLSFTDVYVNNEKVLAQIGM